MVVGMIVVMVMIAAATFIVFVGRCGSAFEIQLCVRDFFFSGCTNFTDLDLKSNGLSRERMIRIHDECILKYLDDPHGHRISVGTLCDEFVSEGNILAAFEVRLVYLENAVFVMMPEGIVGRHRDVPALARAHSRETTFQPRDDLRVSVHVLQRLPRCRTIRRVPVFVEEDIRQRNVRVGTYGER